ncbi:hypothetical protein MIND_00007000 [Mycena indigotica]|uniref:BTB domain-containing protein n=1 Tax=Mycena indigotica TaxID=2126181 RepID=A0A8H6TCI2_9AGAR|nr:uncharacterized protein MIND_00007000 [Mycena indigotica]KAF7314931.1 hypothetical protein MIND_00007000 [Mycena indigotica]
MDAPLEPHRVAELWFDDGNIVLQAGRAQYKVYRGILARQASVFGDMLAFPQPAPGASGDKVDGCPLVQLQDAEVDITAFLTAIFVPFSFRPFPALTTVDMVIGCARLGHKYNAPIIRRLALTHLTSALRTTLAESDATCYEEDKSERGPSAVASWDCAWDDHLIALVQLAREIDAPWLLPSLFYLIAGKLDSIAGQLVNGTVIHGAPARLHPGDQERVLRGASRQQQAAWTLAEFMTPAPPSVCHKDTGMCPLRIMRTATSAPFRDHVHRHSQVPLSLFDERLGDDWYGADWQAVCQTCKAHLHGELKAARGAFWDSLPELYGLPPWEELEELKRAAIGDDLLV